MSRLRRRRFFSQNPRKRFYRSGPVSQRLRAAVQLIVLALAMFAARPALADARTEARVYFKKGMEAISAGKYEEGISSLEKAYEILPHPNVLYNIARAHVEAGNLEKAVENFKKYLETNPPDKDDTLAVVKALEARLKKQEAEREKGQPEPALPEKPVSTEKPVSPEKPVTPQPGPPQPPAPGQFGAARTEDVFA